MEKDPSDSAAAMPIDEPTNIPNKVKSPVKRVASPRTGMAAQNSWVRKAPKKYVLSMKGNKYAIALTQLTLLLQGSEEGSPVDGAVVGGRVYTDVQILLAWLWHKYL
jgi:hypothetical protein